jgi:hypothetical protein
MQNSYAKYALKHLQIILKINMINVGFAELKGKPLNTSFLLAPFWLKANIRNVMIHTGCPKNSGLTTYYRIQDV